MVSITEIGTLVSIVKGLLDIGKSSAPALEHKDNAGVLQRFQQRIGIIAEQMQSSIILTKMLPLWLNAFETVNLFDDQLDNEKAKLLETKLRRLLTIPCTTNSAQRSSERIFKPFPPSRVLSRGFAAS